MIYENMDGREGSDCTGQTRPAFHVAIVYDDRVAATRALNLFHNLNRRFGDEFNFQCDLWRFDVLTLPEIFGAAIQKGEAADLIVVSTHGDTDLPVRVKRWLDCCVAAKPPGSAALVGLLKSRHPSGDGQDHTRQFLQTAAERGLIDFFLQETDWPPANRQRTRDDVPPRPNAPSPVVPRIRR